MTEIRPLVDIDELSLTYGRRAAPAVDRVSLHISAGETLGLVGESGCGKSSLAQAILGYVSAGGRLTGGHVYFAGKDLFALPARELRQLRGGKIAIVGQQPMSALNPSLRIRAQLEEVAQYHQDADRTVSHLASIDMLQKVRFRDPSRIMNSFPHQLSGGQAQRVVLAMALLGEPSLLVLDEPTTALDATVEAEIIELVARLRDETRMALLFVSHDINLVARITDRVAVMAGGRILEQGDTGEIFTAPRKYYTRALIAASPRLETVPTRPAREDGEIVLEVAGADKSYRHHANAFGARRHGAAIPANRQVSLTMHAGETVAVIGESGSGKSTLAKLVTGLETVDGGEIRLLGHELGHVAVTRRPREAVRAAQMVFQNPEATLTPTRRVGAQIARAVKKLGSAAGRRAIAARTDELMDEVHLPLELKHRYPSELSGGEKQRVAIARARAGEPALLVADEPVSALDVTVQKTVLEAIDSSSRQHGTAVLLISHDLAVVRSMADRIVVMLGGLVMEEGTTSQIFDPPYHPYTLELLAAAIGETGARPDTIRQTPEAGCPFFMRCYAAISGTCDTSPPPRQHGEAGHSIACHVPIELLSADDEDELA